MRTVASFLLGLLALVAVAGAAPGLWFERTIVDESGYVSLVAPLGDDPEFRTALADTVADAVVSDTGLDGVAGRAADGVVRRVADGMTELSGFDAAWTEVNTLSHRLNVTDMPPAELDGRLGVDLSPMVDLVVDAANRRLGTQLQGPTDLVVAVGTPEQRDVVDRLRELAPWSWALGGAAVLLFAGAVAAARRRGTALVLLGLGLVAIAAVEMILAVAGGDRVVDEVAAGAGFGRSLMEQVHDEAVRSYAVWMAALAIAGAVSVVSGLVVRSRPEARP
ncbi:hypothetical protein KV102_08305 [Mumia sp. zg.B53]|uniref:hypothetical protein n=1 Tax=Mumia sp. zg.B53 TaxID=2855449 RepID=UPI001C6E909A|nr:hypothetical protein [Mumia sp. zg.B53]MBW9214843.1 hypothetical protein [Mumia sp. zg.B53]